MISYTYNIIQAIAYDIHNMADIFFDTLCHLCIYIETMIMHSFTVCTYISSVKSDNIILEFVATPLYIPPKLPDFYKL